MDALIPNLAQLARSVALASAVAAWCYCVYCCNRIERTRGAHATALPLRFWLGDGSHSEASYYRRRCLISSAVFASLIVFNGALDLLGVA